MDYFPFKEQIKKLIGKDFIEIGAYTYGAHNIVIHFNMATLIIGKFCSISNDVHIFLGGNHNLSSISTYPFRHTNESQELSSPIPNHPLTKGKVVIGNDVWIGSGVSIMSGITIGDGAVIAARSHVVSDVPSYSVYGGNPAKLIKMRFEPELLAEIKSLKWWDYPKERIAEIIPLLTNSKIDIDLLREISKSR